MSNETWETTELSLATYISMETEQDPVLEWSDEGTCVFVFESTKPLLEFVTRFVGGTARVEPREYFLRSASLRRKLNNSRRRN